MKQWFPFNKDNSTKQAYLFCFHHGGTAASFRIWTQYESPLEIIPVELPGKASRMSEVYIESFEELVPDAAEAILEKSKGKKIFLYGHSMGAIFAFSIAYQLEKLHGINPELLIVAGRHAPHFPNQDAYHSSMGNDKLLEELKRLSGTPKEIINSKELQSFLLPVIRRDYILNESYCYQGEKISCPILAHAGTKDPDAGKELMSHWKEVTSGSMYLEEYGGTHFFINELENYYFTELIRGILQLRGMVL
jgi:medium-chain acyl-[acyl-carrier-protein] hydrolase